MFDFQFNENFEPSSNTKEWCLYTHKTEHRFAGIPLPGLFQTTHHEWQVIGFIAIFLLEGIATIWCFREGVQIAAILASIFFDLALAIGGHFYQKDICRMKNELVYEDDKVVLATKRKLKHTITKQYVFYFFIFLSATFKIYWFLSVYGIPDAIALFIVTCYSLGALLHVKCTGFAIFTFFFNRKINSEHNQYIDTKGEAYAFDPNNPLSAVLKTNELTPVESGRHKIGVMKNRYQLTCLFLPRLCISHPRSYRLKSGVRSQ